MGWRKCIFAFMAFQFLTFGVQAANKNAQNLDENDIKQTINQYVEAYNQQNADQLSKFWTDNASYYNATTQESLSGRDQILKYFQEEFSSPDQGTLKVNASSISVKGPDKALQRGIAEVTYKDNTSDQSYFQAEFTKQNGKWLLSKVIEIEDKQPISHYNELKGLEWLVGNWINEDDIVKASSSYKWDLNKNFLQGDITVQIFDNKDLQVQQVIGWDPETKKIRSWAYDSDGGFGTSQWHQQGDSWYAVQVYNLPNGGKASATNVYTKVDDSTYNFSSIERDVNGTILPDVGPFKITRVK